MSRDNGRAGRAIKRAREMAQAEEAARLKALAETKQNMIQFIAAHEPASEPVPVVAEPSPVISPIKPARVVVEPAQEKSPKITVSATKAATPTKTAPAQSKCQLFFQRFYCKQPSIITTEKKSPVAAIDELHAHLSKEIKGRLVLNKERKAIKIVFLELLRDETNDNAGNATAALNSVKKKFQHLDITSPEGIRLMGRYNALLGKKLTLNDFTRQFGSKDLYQDVIRGTFSKTHKLLTELAPNPITTCHRFLSCRSKK